MLVTEQLQQCPVAVQLTNLRAEEPTTLDHTLTWIKNSWGVSATDAAGESVESRGGRG